MSENPETHGAAHTETVQKLFLQHQPAIRSYILSMIPDFSLTDDVMQEVFLVVTRKASGFTLGSSFPAWVKTIARFKALEAIRSAKGNRFETLSDEVLDALGAEQREFFTQTDERLHLLGDCLKQLAPQARRSIEFRYCNDHLPPEIANLMGCTIPSVNVTLSRARAFLRECVIQKMSAKAH
ncbi:MAG TPA: sigma-70 family RNA polymerase sigma factor [Luteolibacter sp.]|nr:sigma-70 family RNA polymerase sigma factor [Luteolibacter sp.]